VTQGPCWGRIGSEVTSCETCTRSHARCDDPDDDDEEEDEDDEDGVSNLARTSVSWNHRDQDATVEGWVVSVSWDAEPDVCLEAAVARFCALRSTPSTILEPDGWLA
jgi:hypothetical protein